MTVWVGDTVSQMLAADEAFPVGASGDSLLTFHQAWVTYLSQIGIRFLFLL